MTFFWIFIIVMGAFLLGFSGLNEPSKKEKEEGKKSTLSNFLILFGSGFLIIGLLQFYKSSCQLEMRRRLNEPISSKEQLYGYEILNKRHTIEKTSFDNPEVKKFFIDIKDIMPVIYYKRGSLKDIEITEHFYNKVKMGEKYFPKDPNDLDDSS